MKPPIEFRPKAAPEQIRGRAPDGSVTGRAGRQAGERLRTSFPQAKSAAPKGSNAKPGKKTAKPKKAANEFPKPHKTTATIAPDIPALAARFLNGTLQDKDWDDIVAILNAAEARRVKNKLKQRNWRGKK